MLFKCLGAALALLFVLPAAEAGDVANLQILGFSGDGGIFAFEEYGELDGSGDAYSNRFYIDTTTDTFLKGTPIRVRLEDDVDAPAEARKQSRQRGEAILPSAVLNSNPGHLAGFNAVTEYSADPSRMLVNPSPVFPSILPPLEFRIEQFPVIAPAGCENMGDIVSLRLVRLDATPGGVTSIVHEDKTVPATRNCPNSYQFGGIQTWITNDGVPVYAVMIAIRSVGFEGPNFRWMAVTGRL